MKSFRIRHMSVFLMLLLALVALSSSVRAGSPTALLPIGAGYTDTTLSFFAEQAVARNTDNSVQIRVLPITYATDPYSITPEERAENLALAQSRAAQVNDACQTLVTPPTTCDALAVDIQVRDDAQDPLLVNQISNATDGVFILGGDQAIAMQVTANTLLENVLETQYLSGMPISGTSAGAAVQSRYMISGYFDPYWPWDALKLGTLDLWYDDISTDHRGLRFGFENGIFEQHALERGRLARLLQATEQLPANHIGIGADWGTGVLMQNENFLTEVQGDYAAIVIDQETYGAAASAAYLTPDQILSIHGVGFHVLPPGNFGYDLTTRTPLVNSVPQSAPSLGTRNYGLSLLPAGVGTLYVAGDLDDNPTGEVAQDFATLAQAHSGPTVIFTLGYANYSQAVAAANTWATRLSNLGVTSIQTAPLNLNAKLTYYKNKFNTAGEIFIVGGDQALLADQILPLQNAGVIQKLFQRWQAGVPVLFDNAAAAAVGAWMSDAPAPSDPEIEGSETFIAGYTPIVPGFGFLPGVVIEPRFMYDYRYGRLVAHGNAHPEIVGLGIERGTALKITSQEIRVLGDMAIFTIDPRFATFQGLGTNNAFAASWLILDTFVKGEVIPPMNTFQTDTQK